MTKATTRKRRYYAVERRQKGICCGEGLGICGRYKLCDAKNRALKVVTSRYHSGNFFSKEETLRVTGMAALSITSLLSFNAEEQKSIKKGENYYKSGHVESFTYNQGVLRGDVHVSMTNKLYKFTVS